MSPKAVAEHRALEAVPARFRPSRLFPLREKVPRALRIVYKDVRIAFTPVRTPEQRRYLFIFGCQRSGTTLLTHIFERDVNAKVYGEHSKLSSRDTAEALRLNPVPEVLAELDGSKYRLTAAKPLVESQNAGRLLKTIPGLKAIWLFRRYADVASSDLKLFGPRNGIANLRPIAANDADDWRCQNLGPATRRVVESLFDEDMSPYDAAALFWYVRNALFFEQSLDEEPSVLLVRYEDLVSQPEEQIRRIYRFVGAPFPGPQITGMVNARSVGKGANIELSDPVRGLCDELHERLMRAYRGQIEAGGVPFGAGAGTHVAQAPALTPGRRP